MIPKKDVETLATLSRIELSEEEKDRLIGEFSAILDYVSELGEASLSTEQVGEVHNVFREDENPHLAGAYTEVLLSSAHEREGNHVVVKKIM